MTEHQNLSADSERDHPQHVLWHRLKGHFTDDQCDKIVSFAAPFMRDAAQPTREKALEAAALDFIAKVDRGEARSTKSYAAFKAALASQPSPAATVETNRFETTKAGVIDWKMEAERANRLLAQAERPKCGLCGLEDGACICAHLPPRLSAGSAESLRRQLEDTQAELEAWFGFAERAETEAAPALINGLKGYLRTCQSGGMPKKQADLAMAVLEDYCRLYAGEALAPVLRAIAKNVEIQEAPSLNREGREHPSYDNPLDPFASPDRLPEQSAVTVPARETVARILAHKMPSLRMANDTPGNYAHSIADEIIAALTNEPQTVPQEEDCGCIGAVIGQHERSCPLSRPVRGSDNG